MTVTWGTTTTYPHPSKLDETPEFVGGISVMADGSLAIDAIATKKSIKLVWEGISSSESAALYAQAIVYTSATMDMSNAGGANYGSVVPIPGTARRTPLGGTPIVYDFSVEVRTA